LTHVERVDRRQRAPGGHRGLITPKAAPVPTIGAARVVVADSQERGVGPGGIGREVDYIDLGIFGHRRRDELSPR
jgi:hypothetical protein